MPIIPKKCGGIKQLSKDLVEQYGGIVLYNRVSSYGQAGRKKEKLKEKTKAVADQVRRLFPECLMAIMQEAKEGKLAEHRPRLRNAALFAKKMGYLLVASDLSRFFRATSYHKRKNPDAWPTIDEFVKFRKITYGVPLATVERPDLSERERQSLATKRTGKVGRPRSITDEMASEIFKELGYLAHLYRGLRWQYPIADVAKMFKVSPAAIVRASYRPSPAGPTWRELAEIEAEKEGLHKILENGDIEITLFGPSSKRGWYGKRGRPPKWVKKGF